MTNSQDLYSVFVTWVKVILPTCALALLSTIFMFSGQVDVTQSLPYAELNVDEIIRDQRISAPLMTSVVNDGTAITLSAAYASPDPANTSKLTATNLNADIVGTDGSNIRITAPSGFIDGISQTADLSGGVRLIADDILNLSTETLRADVENGLVETKGSIIAEGQFGRVEAGKMVLQRSADGSQFLFTNGVRLIYRPKP